MSEPSIKCTNCGKASCLYHIKAYSVSEFQGRKQTSVGFMCDCDNPGYSGSWTNIPSWLLKLRGYRRV